MLQHSMIPDGSPLLRAAFVALVLLVAGFLVAAIRRADRGRAVAAAVVVSLWLALTGAAAAAGALHFSPPPTMLVLFVLTLAIAVGVARAPLGRRLALELPLAALVGFQAFRVAVELLLHRAYTEGLVPVQMSYSGRNFDVVTGLTAIAVAAWVARGRSSPRLVLAWNTLGLALLLNILAVALLSAPTPFRVFMNEPANVWVTRAPWVWLPALMVPVALVGHLLVYRRLWIESREGTRLRSATMNPFSVSG